MKVKVKDAKCIGCGCTDSRACTHPVIGPCFWVKVDYELGIGVCSECVEKIEEFEEKILASRGVVACSCEGAEKGNA